MPNVSVDQGPQWPTFQANWEEATSATFSDKVAAMACFDHFIYWYDKEIVGEGGVSVPPEQLGLAIEKRDMLREARNILSSGTTNDNGRFSTRDPHSVKILVDACKDCNDYQVKYTITITHNSNATH